MSSAAHVHALRELKAVERANPGRLSIGRISPSNSETGSADIAVTVNLAGLGTPSDSGPPLIDNEEVVLEIPADYPFRMPGVRVGHGRFARLHHVEWGNRICLYQSTTDWRPELGMWDVVERLRTWFERASTGTLAGPELPWHAPAVYVDLDAVSIVINADLPTVADPQPDAGVWWAQLARCDGGHLEVWHWLDTLPYEIPPATVVAPLIVLPDTVGYAYPTTVDELRTIVYDGGFHGEDCLRLLARSAQFNRRSRDPSLYNEIGNLILIGTPAADLGRVAHIAAWHVPTNERTDGRSRPRWRRVYDQRPSIARRRDTSRPATWLAGQRVLVLGCGGLGAPIAEQCVRAGASELHLVDHGVVAPGILVRQPFAHRDIGRSKVVMLGERLGSIDSDVLISRHGKNAIDVLREHGPDRFDLIVDATANRAVGTWLELQRWVAASDPPPIVTVVVGHECRNGVATVSLPAASGAGIDAFRQLAVSAATDPDLEDVLEDFYPTRPRTDVFQPEPGCSDPTYVGSAVDVNSLAAQLFNGALDILDAATGAADTSALTPTRSAIIVQPTTYGSARNPYRRLHWPSDPIYLSNGYQVRVAPGVVAAIRAVVTQQQDTRSEIGGVLLGQVNHACRIVWVSRALGPSQHTRAAPHHLVLDAEDVAGRSAELTRQSRGTVDFVGAWHSHPDSSAAPSPQDVDTMSRLARETPWLGASVLMIVRAHQEDLEAWTAGSSRPPLHVELFLAPVDE